MQNRISVHSMMCTWHCCQRTADQDMLCMHHYRLMHPLIAPPAAHAPINDEKQEFAQRPFGSVNAYVRQLEIENATLRRALAIHAPHVIVGK